MKIFKKAVLIMSVLFLCACSNVKHYVAYTIYPVGYLLNRIGGNKIETVSIQDSSLVQTAQISKEFISILDDSYFFFHVGNLEPYMDLYDEEIASTGVTQIDLSSYNSIYKFQRYSLVYVDGKDTYVEGPYYEGDVFSKIDTYDLDLFLWLDPIGMLSMAKDIKDTLSQNYVEQSSFFNENYENLKNDLIALDAAFNSLSQDVISKKSAIKFVSMTASFDSWQKAYGFQVYPVCLSKYGSLPSDEELEIIKARIKADDVKYIAYEANMTDEMVSLFNKLEKELGLKRVYLNNISSLTQTQKGENKDYLTLMYENLSVLESMTNKSSKSVEITEEVDD